jgi:Kef-type K+ transport system membrane component KefB
MSVVNESRAATRYEGPIAPIVASIVGIIAWLVFILVYALFWSKSFDLFQNIIVTIVSLSIAGLVIGLMWLIWFKPTGELRRTFKEAN